MSFCARLKYELKRHEKLSKIAIFDPVADYRLPEVMHDLMQDLTHGTSA